MAHYLLGIYQPAGGTPPSAEQLEQITARLDAVNTEIRAAGAWVFAGGLDHPSTATVITDDSGEPVLTDGPFAELKEYLGGLTILDVPDLDAALGWASKLHAAIGLPIEVRPFATAFG